MTVTIVEIMCMTSLTGYLSPTVAHTKHANSLIINDSYQANA
jgi:hypothetical protein